MTRMWAKTSPPPARACGHFHERRVKRPAGEVRAKSGSSPAEHGSASQAGHRLEWRELPHSPWPCNRHISIHAYRGNVGKDKDVSPGETDEGHN